MCFLHHLLRVTLEPVSSQEPGYFMNNFLFTSESYIAIPLLPSTQCLHFVVQDISFRMANFSPKPAFSPDFLISSIHLFGYLNLGSQHRF